MRKTYQCYTVIKNNHEKERKLSWENLYVFLQCCSCTGDPDLYREFLHFLWNKWLCHEIMCKGTTSTARSARYLNIFKQLLWFWILSFSLSSLYTVQKPFSLACCKRGGCLHEKWSERLHLHMLFIVSQLPYISF